MGKYLDWYVVELEHGLTEVIPPARLQDTLGEVRQHLEESTAGFVEHGSDRVEAERQAIRAFGFPDAVCASIKASQRATIFGVPNETAVIGAVAALTSIACWQTIVAGSSLSSAVASGGITSLTVPLGIALAAFAVGSYRAGRVMWGPLRVAAGMLAMSVIIGNGISQVTDSTTGARTSREVLRYVGKAHRSGAALDRQIAARFSEGVAAFAPGTKPTEIPARYVKELRDGAAHVTAYLVPNSAARDRDVIKTRGSYVALSVSAATRCWQTYGRRDAETWREAAETLDRRASRTLAAANRPGISRRAMAAALPDAVAAGGVWLIGLGSLAWFSAAAGSAVLRRRPRRQTVV